MFYAGTAGSIHHLQWSVTSVSSLASSLTERWGAVVLAQRDLEIALRLGSTLVLLSQRQEVARPNRYSF